MIYVKKILKILMIININMATTAYTTNMPNYDVNCGIKALMGICYEFKVYTTIDNIRKLAWYDQDVGTTMFGLAHAANELKLPVVPCKLEYNELKNIDKPGVVFVNGNHFSIAWKLTNNKVTLQDWPDCRHEISRKEFESIWNGEVIIFSKFHRWIKSKEVATLFKPFPGPRIMFTKKEKDMGEVNEGDLISSKFSYVNIGSKPLKISVRSNCSCTAALLSDKEINPGGIGEIKVAFNTNGRPGSQISSVKVISNDPENRITTITLSAIVKTQTKSVPKRLWIDRVIPGRIIKKNFEVYAHTDSTFEIKEIHADDGIKVLKKKTKVDSEGVRISFGVNIIPKGPIGMYSKKIIIVSNRSGKKIIIPIDGEIVGPIEAVPPVVFLGDVKHGSEFEKTLSLRQNKGTDPFNPSDFKIKSNVKGSLTVDAKIEEGKPGEYVLLVKGTADKKSETVDGSIDIFNEKSEKVLSVPVYGIVKN